MANFLRKFILTLSVISPLYAKDFGVVGHTFPIQEEDLLEFLKGKMIGMGEDDVQRFSETVRKHFVDMVSEPRGVTLGEAQAYRVFEYDPTITLAKDLYDHEGKLIIAGGSKLNPLQFVALGTDLLFIDGTNERHIKWARSQSDGARWILTKGNPLDLEEKEGRAIYFDQYGVITRKLEIENIPARVSQKKNEPHLTIEEIPL